MLKPTLSLFSRSAKATATATARVISFRRDIYLGFMSAKGQTLPKFGEWDVNDPASAEGFTAIFTDARNQKKTGGKPDSPRKVDTMRHANEPLKPQRKKWLCCM